MCVRNLEPLYATPLKNAKVLQSKVTSFWSYYKENLVPVKVRTNNQNYK